MNRRAYKSFCWLSIVFFFGLSLVFAVDVKGKETDLETRYRGFGLSHMDYETLRAAKEEWGANQVRYIIAPIWHKGGCSTSLAAFDAKVAALPEALETARGLGLAVIVNLHQLPNDNPRKLPEGIKFENEMERRKAASKLFWSDSNNLRIMKECWIKLSKVTAKYPDMDIWLEIYNEPLDWNDFPSYPHCWPKWAEQVISKVRKIDRVHPLLMCSGPGALSWGMKDLKPFKDPCDNVIYTIHMWQPHGYTHQGISSGNTIQDWPGLSPSDGNKIWDKSQLLEDVRNVIEFQKKYDVRIHVGEFGISRYAPNGAKFLEDSLELIESLGWDWNYHSFRGAGVWSLERSSEITMYKDLGLGKKEKITSVIIPEILNEKEKYVYEKYGVPRGGMPLEELDARGKIVKNYMLRNKANASGIGKIYDKILIIGNSLSHHSPIDGADGLVWKGDWGMAASRESNDYAHLLHSSLQIKQAEPIMLQIEHIEDENLTMSGYSHLLATDADLVVFQLGDNFRGNENPEGFRIPYERLVADVVNGADSPTVIVVGTWWERTNLNSLIQQVAVNTGAIFVPIHHLQGHDTMAISEPYRDKNWVDGVQWHPGDKGMKIIAEAILKKL